jgi:hypothetical protein
VEASPFSTLFSLKSIPPENTFGGYQRMAKMVPSVAKDSYREPTVPISHNGTNKDDVPRSQALSSRGGSGPAAKPRSRGARRRIVEDDDGRLVRTTLSGTGTGTSRGGDRGGVVREIVVFRLHRSLLAGGGRRQRRWNLPQIPRTNLVVGEVSGAVTREVRPSSGALCKQRTSPSSWSRRPKSRGPRRPIRSARRKDLRTGISSRSRR